MSSAERRLGGELLERFRVQFPETAEQLDNDELSGEIVNSCTSAENQKVSVTGVEQRFGVLPQKAASIAEYLASDICAGIDYTGLPHGWSQ